MRFLSSSALASAEKLRLAASCSAAEAMAGSELPPSRRGRARTRPSSRPDRWKSWTPGTRSRRRRRRSGGALRAASRLRRAGSSTDAAGLLDRRDRRLRGALDRESDLGLELAARRAAARRPWRGAARRPAPAPRRRSCAPASSLPASIACWTRPRLTSLSLDANGVVEAALGQAPMQRHLAAFEALDAHARARGLALAAAAAGLALARADAAADAHARSCARPAGRRSR